MSDERTFDLLAIAQDLVRREEAERLHEAIHAEHRAASESSDEEWVELHRASYLKGLDEAMLIIDARIGHLRDRWG